MDQYADIINLPHHVSEKRTPMSMIDRGAQFSPFAALTGYDAVIAESARRTESCVELSEGTIAELDQKLQDLRDRIVERPWAVYTCFQPDERKAGGRYVHIRGRLQKYDCLEDCLILLEGEKIPIDSIISIETE